MDRPTLLGWVDSTAPAGHLTYRFHWTLTDERRGSGGGRGSALIAAPDSLRFDYRAALGAGSGAAAVVGDTALWAEPEEDVRKLVPSYPLLWAMVGVARPPSPEPEWRLEGIRADQVTAWRYVRGADTVEYAWEGGAASRLRARVVDGGRPLGTVITICYPDRRPARSRLVVAGSGTEMVLKFDEVTRPVTFGPEEWLAPRDQ